MSALEIRLYDDPVLRERARPIETIESRHHELAERMIETMRAGRGIGLAANQVGVTERIIVVDRDACEEQETDGQPSRVLIMLNPIVLEESTQDAVLEEGCLSLPDIRGDVWRPRSIRVRWQGLDGRWHEMAAADLLARCILHEIDHLDGILFIDRMAPEARRKLAGKLQRLRLSRVR